MWATQKFWYPWRNVDSYETSSEPASYKAILNNPRTLRLTLLHSTIRGTTAQDTLRGTTAQDTLRSTTAQDTLRSTILHKTHWGVLLHKTHWGILLHKTHWGVLLHKTHWGVLLHKTHWGVLLHSTIGHKTHWGVLLHAKSLNASQMLLPNEPLALKQRVDSRYLSTQFDYQTGSLVGIYFAWKVPNTVCSNQQLSISSSHSCTDLSY